MTSLFALQKLQPMKTYQLRCYLMRGKCYRNIPGAKGCNGKSTTDLKAKIIFAAVENISWSTPFSLDCNKRLYFWIWFKFPWRVLSAQPSPFQALITITKTAENSGTRKWKYFHFWIQLSKSFCSSLPCFLCSSAALESLHTEAKASS